MRAAIFAVALFAVTTVADGQVLAQRATVARISAPDDDNLITGRLSVAAPERRMRVADLGNLTVQTGDSSTQSVREIVVESFGEQQVFAERMNRAELVNAGALVALPEIDDEVLVFDDAFVIRRSTTIIVSDPDRVARESELFRNYIGERAERAQIAAAPQALDAEERAGLENFIANEVEGLHPDDPIRAAAAAGEAALLDAIEAGLGRLTVEDTLIIPRVAGVSQGADLRIPTVRNGILDLRNPEPVRDLSLQGISVPSPPPTRQPAGLAAVPATPAPPARAPQQLEPRIESSGREEITAEFLLGVTRAGNFQWERTWGYTSGFFRLTLGAGFAFGYRVPVVAEAVVEPTYGLIQDYSDRRVIIATEANVHTVDGNSAFYSRAGLSSSQVKGGDEVLFEANVGWGYKFRAFWKTIAQRPYTAIGVSYSQSFKPPEAGLPNQWTDFGVNLDPNTTGITYNGTFLSGGAYLRFFGRTWGAVGIDYETRADNTVQAMTAITPGSQAVNITMNPIPLRQGQTTQTRPFGVRFVNPSYTGRIIVVPGLRFSFGVGYRNLKRTFSTQWINLQNLAIDTGETSLGPHSGTPSSLSWNDGEKVHRRIEQGPARPGRIRIGN